MARRKPATAPPRVSITEMPYELLAPPQSLEDSQAHRAALQVWMDTHGRFKWRERQAEYRRRVEEHWREHPEDRFGSHGCAHAP